MAGSLLAYERTVARMVRASITSLLCLDKSEEAKGECRPLQWRNGVLSTVRNRRESGFSPAYYAHNMFYMGVLAGGGSAWRGSGRSGGGRMRREGGTHQAGEGARRR
eukprot:1189573-Prorocentrum_minimum.AAC.1